MRSGSGKRRVKECREWRQLCHELYRLLSGIDAKLSARARVLLPRVDQPRRTLVFGSEGA